MIGLIFRSAIAAAMVVAAPVAQATELLMVEQAGCHYCIEWKEEIGPIYPKTEVGAYAPLSMVSLASAPPEGVQFARPVTFTPTFILLENGQELSRIEGYPGEDFFWGLLEVMLVKHTDFAKPVQTN